MSDDSITQSRIRDNIILATVSDSGVPHEILAFGMETYILVFLELYLRLGLSRPQTVWSSSYVEIPHEIQPMIRDFENLRI